MSRRCAPASAIRPPPGCAGASRRARAVARRLHAPGDPHGATLIARIDDLYLGPNFGPGFFGGSQDTINGPLVIRPARRGRGRNPDPGDPFVPPDPRQPAIRVESNYWRVFAGAAFAGWAPTRARALEASASQRGPCLRRGGDECHRRPDPSARNGKSRPFGLLCGHHSHAVVGRSPSGSARSGLTLRRYGPARATQPPTGWSKRFPGHLTRALSAYFAG